jgi:hypothetical protein
MESQGCSCKSAEVAQGSTSGPRLVNNLSLATEFSRADQAALPQVWNPCRSRGGAGRKRPMKYILIDLAIAAAVLVIVGLRRALRTYLKFRGKRLVSCPETHQPAAVRVAAGTVALKATVGNEQLRLSECSRWPERGSLRARMCGANPRGAEGLPGLDDHKPVVSGTEVRLLPQTVRRNPLARSSTGAAGFRAQDC